MTASSALAAIVLAAGKGTRMKSSRAKVLHEVFYRPMLHHVLDAVQPLRAVKTIVIVGHQRDRVEQAISTFPVTCVEQHEQLGTGHAVLCAKAELADFSGTVLVLCGDSPLLQTRHLQEMLETHHQSGTALTIMTTRLDQPTGYGRIISNREGAVQAIVEEKDASLQQRRITEINAGLYCVEKEFLFAALNRVTRDNSQKEMYLTDIVGIAVADGIAVGRYEHPVPFEVLGVNSRVELALAHGEIRRRRNRELLAAGITMHDPASITVAPTVEIGPDCTLTERITILGTSRLGARCRIGAGVVLDNADIGPDVEIGANSVLSGCSIKAGTRVPPLSVGVSGEGPGTASG